MLKKIKKKLPFCLQMDRHSSPEVAMASLTPSIFKGCCPGLWASHK